MEDKDDNSDSNTEAETETETESDDEDGEADGTSRETDAEQEQEEEIGERLLDDCTYNLGPETYVVSTSGQDSDEVVVNILVGDYRECHESGNCHGRKVFKKVLETAMAETVAVFMYYQDHRGGTAFEGWWLGDKVGGTHVWSHNANSSMSPPSTGWKIPWDGAVRTTLSIVNKTATVNNEIQSTVKAVSSDTVLVFNAAKSGLEQAKTAADDYSSTEGLKTAEGLLQPHGIALLQSMKKLTEEQLRSAPEALGQIAQLRSACQILMSSINEELGKVRALKGKAAHAESNKAADDRDSLIFMNVLPEATQKTNAAVDAVEKVVIISQMIAAGGDHSEEVRGAVTATEQALQEAQKAVNEARALLNFQKAAARRFESEKVRAKAAMDLGQLQAQLLETQSKLNSLNNIQQEFVQRSAAQKIVQELLEKLSLAEADVDRAEKNTAMLLKGGINNDTMQQAVSAVTEAEDHVAQVICFIESKKTAAMEKVNNELMKMEDRARGSQMRLAEMRNSQKEVTEREWLEALVDEAADKLKTVAQTVAKAADAEDAWLVDALNESVSAIEHFESTATAANTAASIAHTFIAMKLAEAEQFTAELSSEAKTKLKAIQTELESITKELSEMEKHVATRKDSMSMREAEQEVNKSEERAAEVPEAGASLLGDTKLGDVSSADALSAAEFSMKDKHNASAELAETKSSLAARQVEANGTDVGGSEASWTPIQYETRPQDAHTETAQCKRGSSTVDQCSAAQQNVEDAQAQSDVASTELAKLREVPKALANTPKTVEDDNKDLADKATSKESEEKALQKNIQTGDECSADADASLKTACGSVEIQAIGKLSPKIYELIEHLDASEVGMRERSEEAALDIIGAGTEGLMNEVEESSKKLAEAEETSGAEATEVLTGQVSEPLATVASAASTTTNSVPSEEKTIVGVKKFAARRFYEPPRKQADDELNQMMGQLGEQAETLVETNNMNDCEMELVRKEVVAKVDEAEKKVNESEVAIAALSNFGKTPGGGEGSGEGADKAGKKEGGNTEMIAACEKAGSAQQEARNSVKATQKLLLARQKDAKRQTTRSALLVVSNISVLLRRLSKMVSTLDKQKVALRDHEHCFVAQRLREEATEKVTELEHKLAAVLELASPMTTKEGISSVVFLGYAVECLKKDLKADSKTPKELFTELRAEKAGVTQIAFSKKMKALAQKDPKDMTLSQEQLKAAFNCLAGRDADEVPEAKFLNLFTMWYLCRGAVTMTDGMFIRGSKTVRKIDANEVLEVLGEPAKDEMLGLVRAQVKAEKDGKQGFVTVTSDTWLGLEVYSPYMALQRGVDQAVKELNEAAQEASKYLDTKAEQLKAVRIGPVADAKAELLKLKPRITNVLCSYTELKKKLSQVDKTPSHVMEEERKKRIESADKKAAAVVVKEIVQAVNAAVKSVGKDLAGAESLIASLGGDHESPLAAMESSQQELRSSQENLEAAMTKIKAKMDEMSGQPVNGQYVDARKSLLKVKVKAGMMKSKCKQLIGGLNEARADLAKQAEEAVLKVFRAYAQAQSVKPDELFKELAVGADEIPAATFRAYLQQIPDSGLKAGQLDMAMDRFSAGLTKLSLLELLQVFQKCIKETAMTTTLEVHEGETIRKLAKDEILEVLEVGRTDEATGAMRRYRCRAMVDGKEGWVTYHDNQGFKYLEKTLKPFYCCKVESTLRSAFESSSSEVRKVQVGEVLEMMEGPRKEEPADALRLQGKASKDGEQGFVTLNHTGDNDNFAFAKMMVCKQSIAITITFDIAAGKALRKLEVGEVLEVLEGPRSLDVHSLSRVRVLAKKDGKEGWVTVQGNKGTVYLEESDKHYVCRKAVPLESKMSPGSTLVRQMEVGEAFEALDVPKSEKREGTQRARGRSLVDGSEGWFTVSGKSFAPWLPTYECMHSTALSDCLEIKDARSECSLHGDQGALLLGKQKGNRRHDEDISVLSEKSDQAEGEQDETQDALQSNDEEELEDLHPDETLREDAQQQLPSVASWQNAETSLLGREAEPAGGWQEGCHKNWKVEPTAGEPIISWADEGVIIIYKPPGWTCTTSKPLHKQGKRAIQHFLHAQGLPDLLGHRLDIDTSGPLAVAQDHDSHDFLRETSSSHRWYKQYHALVHGELSQERWFGRLEYRLLQQHKRTLVDHAKGDIAITDYCADQLLKDREGNTYTSVVIRIKHGRQHQIRVHFQELGRALGQGVWGLVSDRKYAKGPNIAPRIFLHQTRLEIPLRSGVHGFDCELPQDLRDVLQQLTPTKLDQELQERWAVQQRFVQGRTSRLHVGIIASAQPEPHWRRK
eukprot:TRINITY_DN1695_c0_g2_i1.p1 TRINITY_DN1695_c0_g2~~TRINITY_DN1695_c0_g2_i1.p1  ORF type:complete len:2308 (+),score=581.34 TRINITY_DN1695_c0_g2_i1:65-6988(+)